MIEGELPIFDCRFSIEGRSGVCEGIGLCRKGLRGMSQRVAFCCMNFGWVVGVSGFGEKGWGGWAEFLSRFCFATEYDTFATESDTDSADCDR